MAANSKWVKIRGALSTENTVGTHYRVIFLCMLERNEAIYKKSPISGVLCQLVDYYVTFSLLSAAKEMGPITDRDLRRGCHFFGEPKDTLFDGASSHDRRGKRDKKGNFFSVPAADT